MPEKTLKLVKRLRDKYAGITFDSAIEELRQGPWRPSHGSSLMLFDRWVLVALRVFAGSHQKVMRRQTTHRRLKHSLFIARTFTQELYETLAVFSIWRKDIQRSTEAMALVQHWSPSSPQS